LPQLFGIRRGICGAGVPTEIREDSVLYLPCNVHRVRSWRDDSKRGKKPDASLFFCRVGEGGCGASAGWKGGPALLRGARRRPRWATGPWPSAAARRSRPGRIVTHGLTDATQRRCSRKNKNDALRAGGHAREFMAAKGNSKCCSRGRAPMRGANRWGSLLENECWSKRAATTGQTQKDVVWLSNCVRTRPGARYFGAGAFAGHHGGSGGWVV